MNNYVLITKRSLHSDHVIDSSDDNLEILSKRLEQLQTRGNLESKIFHASNLATGKEYINDEIEFISKSMIKYQFYPIYRVKTSIKGLDKISTTMYFMSRNLILSNNDFRLVINKLNTALIEVFNKSEINKYIQIDQDLSNSDIYDHKYKLIGMDSWLMDPIGNYYTLNDHLSRSELIKSFKDYMNRHERFSINSSDDSDISLAPMDYSKFPNRRAEHFPIDTRYIGNEDKLKFDKFNNTIMAYLNEY